MKRKYTNMKKERIAYCLIDLFNREVRPVNIPIEVYCNLIGDDTIDSGERLANQIKLFKLAKYKARYTYSVRIITRDYVQAVLKIVNTKLEIPINVTLHHDETAHNKITSYEFNYDKELYLAQHLEQLKKSVRIYSRSFYLLLTEHLGNTENEMQKKLDKYNGKDYESFTLEQLADLTTKHALPVLHYLNQTNHKYELYINSNKYHKEKYQPYFSYNLNMSDNIPVHTETTETYMSIKNTFPLVRYKMSKYTYLIHIYLMYLVRKQNRIILDINDVQTRQKEAYYILEFDTKKVWNFWQNNTPICQSFFSEFTKAVEELENIKINNATNPIFLLPERKKNSLEYDSCSSGNKLYYRLVKSNHNSYYVYVNKTYTDYFLQTENITEYPKKLISISSKTSYSQIMFYELLYEHLPYDTEVTETQIDIPLADFVFKTGKMDIADWRFQNIQRKYAKTANWKCTVFNELLKTNQYKRFLSDLNRYFVEPTIDNINIYLKEAGINRRYTASFHINETDSPFIRFRLVLNDNIMD